MAGSGSAGIVVPGVVRPRPWLQLIRPANLFTAAADVLAGFGLAGLNRWQALPWLVSATVCLYAGGVAFNDVFDAELDARERPERPIPSGRLSRRSAALGAAALLLAGVALATAASPLSGLMASLIATLAVAYDGWAKPRRWWGPLLMAGCRGLNLLLGLSVIPALLLTPRSTVALVSVAYVAAITLASHGELIGATRRDLMTAGSCLGLAALGLVVLSVSALPLSLATLAFGIVLAARLASPVLGAWRSPGPAEIMAAVRAGVVNLILLDAALAAGRAGLVYPLAIVALFVPAGLLARAFAVT
jgi:4-hydroxybenzoate polyprenyltransferase